MNNNIKILSIICSSILFTGCIKDKHLKMNQSFEKVEQFQEKKQLEVLETVKKNEKKVEQSISIYNDSVKTILKKLTQKDQIPYFLVGQDLNLEDSIFKINSIRDLQYYILATTNYRLQIIDNFTKTRIKKVRILKKEQEDSFQTNVGLDLENEIKPIKVFNDISRSTKYTVITRPDVSNLLNTKQTINFTGKTYKDFIDFFKNKYDVYITIDNYEKTITIEKYKMETININIITDIMGGSNSEAKDLTKDLEQSLKGVSDMNN